MRNQNLDNGFVDRFASRFVSEFVSEFVSDQFVEGVMVHTHCIVPSDFAEEWTLVIEMPIQCTDGNTGFFGDFGVPTPA